MFDADSIADKAKPIFQPAEKPETVEGRRAMKIAYSVGIIVLGVILFGVMVRSMGSGSLANPNPLKIMGFMLPLGVAGGGLALVLHYAIPRRHDHVVARIKAIVTVFCVLGAGLLFMKMAYQATPIGPNKTLLLTNPWFTLGAIMATGGTLYAAGYAVPFPQIGRVTVDENRLQDETEQQLRARHKWLESQFANRQANFSQDSDETNNDL